MKQKLLVLALVIVAFACKQNEAPTPTDVNETSYHVVALSNFDFASTKAAIDKNLPLELRASNNKVYHLNRYASVNNVEIAGGEIVTYAIDGVDSIQMVMSGDNVSFQIMDNGESTGYFAYDDPAKLDEVMQAYEANIPETKSGSMLTKSSGSGSINISGLTAGQDSECSGARELTPAQQTLADAENIVNNAYTKAPMKNEVIINLMIGQGADRPISHEVGWAAAEIVNSVNHLFKSKGDRNTPKIIINRLETIFGAGGIYYSRTQNADTELSNFTTWMAQKHKDGVYRGNAIYMLIKQWTYSKSILGMAWMNTYNINNTGRSMHATGIATTCCLYKRTLAHEVGHIFGADHTTTPWYKINYDLMNAYNSVFTKSEFRTDNSGGSGNVSRVYKSLKLK